MGRQDLQPFETRVVFLGAGHAGGDPLCQHAVLARSGIDPQSTAVRNCTAGLGKDQTAARIARNNASALRLSSERVKVAVRVVASQRKLEALLARGGAVARAGVATGLGQHRLDVVTEAPFKRLLEVGNRHLGQGSQVANRGRDGGRPVCQGHGDAILDRDDLRVGNGESYSLSDLFGGRSG